MGINSKWAKTSVLGLAIVAVSAFAAAEKETAKGVTLWGSFEGGYKLGWQTTAASTTSYTGFQVDEAAVNLKAKVGEKTVVQIDNSFFFSPTSTGLTDISSASNFVSRFTTGFMNTRQAYIDHRCADGLHTWVGLFKTPYGMETMWAKYDMPTYYHSQVYRVLAASNESSFNNLYDLGIKWALTDIVPGTLEIALLDGRNTTNAAKDLFLSQALRWSWEWKSGDMSLTPVVSAFFGRWAGGPKDIGVNLGLAYKNAAFWANLEGNWVQMGSQAAGFAANTNTTMMNVYLEPGFDFGAATVSLKAEWGSTTVAAAAAQSDFNVGVAIGKSWENYRVRLAYNHVGLSGNLPSAATAHNNDVRLLFGTKF